MAKQPCDPGATTQQYPDQCRNIANQRDRSFHFSPPHDAKYHMQQLTTDNIRPRVRSRQPCYCCAVAAADGLRRFQRMICLRIRCFSSSPGGIRSQWDRT